MRSSRNIFLLIIILAYGCHPQASTPVARYGAKMIFDPVGERAILFGGRTDGLLGMKYFDDLWSFDSQSQIWTPLQTDIQPAGRLSPGMVYDPVAHQIILFGGHTEQDRVNDTWTYDLDTNHWKEVTPEHSPPPRSDMGMVYDETNQVVILFGGYCKDNIRELCDDTWVFDPQRRIWTEMNPPNHPPVMYGHSLVYDPINQQSLLWGGHISAINDGIFSSIGYGDTLWSYSYPENTWEEIALKSGNNPNPRYWHMSTFDISSESVFLFGGNGAKSFLAETWLFERAEGTWEKITVKDMPSPRINAAIIYDPANDIVILFGGLGEDKDSFRDTWIFLKTETGKKWINVSTSPSR